MSPYRHIEVAPMSSALGAEVRGVDLAGSVSEAAFDEIRRAFREHLLLIFRAQRLSPTGMAAFAERFGPLYHHPYVCAVDGHPGVHPVCKEADEVGYNFGVTWHTDGSFLAAPAMGSMLHALELPPVGGDTLFSNMCLAFESLSPGLQRALVGMTACHSGGDTYGAWGAARRKRALAGAAPDDEVEQPVVGVHPDTGRRFLYVNRVFTTNFRGMTIDESLPLLDYLTAHVARPELTCRLRWEENTLAFWDNRATQHCAIDDYDGHRRRLQRSVILGEPLQPAVAGPG